MKNKLKSTLINLAILSTSIFLSLLILEQGFRWKLFGWKAFSYSEMKNNVPITNTDFTRKSPFDDVYWAFKPNLDTTFKLAHLTTNSYGLADKEYSINKPNNVYRIAVLGDSYSQASGVDTDKSYHALLENKLNSESGQHYELINFAFGGFNLERYNATLKYIVPAWHPDAILLGFCAFNDQVASPPKQKETPPFNPVVVNGFFISYVHRYLNMVPLSEIPNQVRSSTVFIPRDVQFIDNQLKEMRELANHIKPNMPILLAYLDNREHSQEDIANLTAIAKKYNMAFIDTTQPFHGTKIEDYSISLLDSHPNTTAHAMFAQSLFTAIQRDHIFGFGDGATTP